MSWQAFDTSFEFEEYVRIIFREPHSSTRTLIADDIHVGMREITGRKVIFDECASRACDRGMMPDEYLEYLVENGEIIVERYTKVKIK